MIFADTSSKVQTPEGMRSEMRLNRWPQETALSAEELTPDHAIAARGDLTEENPSPSGAVDAKVTSSCLVKRLWCDAVSGTTTDDQTPFRWTDASGKDLYLGQPHDGQHDLWNFACCRCC
ncbi:unnamed protein product [Polarella glacialis]|uniref:Phospholipase B-like n=1 Tax=Polarella glacialis TaxID=89957 RepID=A0A813E2X4_POLGL|nr:unnamed protein product [Polarella glacialis]